MRIIRGNLSGKSINFLKNSITRPLKDSVKENIFNILEHSNLLNFAIKDAKILDLYSGIGSFGIECISRGAESTTFIERDKKACALLGENLNKLSIIKKSKIYNKKIEDTLLQLRKKKFNLIFFDPPFSDINFIKNIEFIKNNKMFKLNHVIVIHRESKSEDQIKDIVNVVLTKKYGRSKIIFGFLV